MRRPRITKQSYIDAVSQKLVKAKDLLMWGPCARTGLPLRDETGVAVTFSNLLSIASNHYDRTGGMDVVADAIVNASNNAQQNFSGESYGDVSKVQTMGAIDVSLILQANSLIPFLAVDRAMSNPVDTIYYCDMLAALDSGAGAGGVNPGDTVSGNFVPPNSNVRLGPASRTLTTASVPGGTTTEVYAFGTYLDPGSIQITITSGATTYTGQDFNKDGNLFFSGGAITSGTVDYTGGNVTINGLTTGMSVTASVILDTDKDSSGSNILKIRASHIPTQLVSRPKQFIFEEDEHANMYMNRIMAVANKVGGLSDYRDLYFGRLTNMYIDDVNRDLLRLIVSLGSGVTPIPCDLSGYTASGSFAPTKHDQVAQFFINLRTDFIQRTGVPASVMVCGSTAGALLEDHPTKWVAGPNYYTQLNGFIGTFNGVPVYRHNYLDTLETPKYATYYLAAKLPDNSSGTLVFGEFLPLVQTSTIGNVANPMQKSTGWFSQVGSIAIQNTLVSKGLIHLTA